MVKACQPSLASVLDSDMSSMSLKRGQIVVLQHSKSSPRPRPRPRPRHSGRKPSCPGPTLLAPDSLNSRKFFFRLQKRLISHRGVWQTDKTKRNLSSSLLKGILLGEGKKKELNFFPKLSSNYSFWKLRAVGKLHWNFEKGQLSSCLQVQTWELVLQNKVNFFLG